MCFEKLPLHPQNTLALVRTQLCGSPGEIDGDGQSNISGVPTSEQLHQTIAQHPDQIFSTGIECPEIPGCPSGEALPVLQNTVHSPAIYATYTTKETFGKDHDTTFHRFLANSDVKSLGSPQRRQTELMLWAKDKQLKKEFSRALSRFDRGHGQDLEFSILSAL